MNCEVAWSIK